MLLLNIGDVEHNPFNPMKSFCPYSQCSHLNVLDFPPVGGIFRRFKSVSIFLNNVSICGCCEKNKNK